MSFQKKYLFINMRYISLVTIVVLFHMCLELTNGLPASLMQINGLDASESLFYDHEINYLFVLSRQGFQKFANNLRMDEMKRKEEQKRQIIRKYLSWHVSATSFLNDFYTPYF
jgi:hypothetical protein